MNQTTHRSWFRCAATDDGAEISIYDEIGLFGITAKDFRDELKALGQVPVINLHINSPGGSVFDGLAIHNMLARHKATVNVTVDGIAASIASVIAMAGDEVLMPANAMMMIHDPSGLVVGTSKDMRELADALDKVKTGIVSAYAGKTRMERDDIAELMAGETWLTAEEAVAMGFADALEEPVQMAASFDLSKFKNAPADAGRNPRGSAAQNPADPEEIPMTDSNTPATEPEAEAEANSTPAETPSEPDAPNAAEAASEPSEDVAAKATAEARNLAKAVIAACNLAGKPGKATEFIEAGTSLNDVIVALQAERSATAPEVSAHHNPKPEANAGEGWGKAVDKVNARV